MERAVLAIGCNLGDRETLMVQMRTAVLELLRPPILLSRCMETEPVDVEKPQPWYLNQIISGYYSGTCRQLLDKCHNIENRLGRHSRGKRLPRTADIDILLFGAQTIEYEDLKVPHIALTRRRFFLEGLAELHANMIIPGTGATSAQLLKNMEQCVRNQIVYFR